MRNDRTSPPPIQCIRSTEISRRHSRASLWHSYNDKRAGTLNTTLSSLGPYDRTNKTCRTLSANNQTKKRRVNECGASAPKNAIIAYLYGGIEVFSSRCLSSAYFKVLIVYILVVDVNAAVITFGVLFANVPMEICQETLLFCRKIGIWCSQYSIVLFDRQTDQCRRFFSGHLGTITSCSCFTI